MNKLLGQRNKKLETTVTLFQCLHLFIFILHSDLTFLCSYLLVRGVQGGLQAPVLLLHLLIFSLQPAQFLLLTLQGRVQLLNALSMLLLNLLLRIQNLLHNTPFCIVFCYINYC